MLSTTWLWKIADDHASAIQAIGSILSALAAIILIFITKRYVRLTKTLAEAANAQIKTAKAMAVSARRQAGLEAVRQYFQQGDTREQIEARKRVAQLPAIEIDPVDAAQVCAFFHFWGVMVRRGFLPMWVFEGSSGMRLSQYYEKLAGFIEFQRNNGNPAYAEHFEWVYRELSNSAKGPLMIHDAWFHRRSKQP